jgi:hypothetical protein
MKSFPFELPEWEPAQARLTPNKFAALSNGGGAFW